MLFSSPAMPYSDWRSLLDDTVRLDALVEGMAIVMAKVLTLKNIEINRGRTSLGRILYEEKERFPTRAQLDEIEEMQEAFNFCRSTESLLGSILRQARDSEDVDLAQFSKANAYHLSWTFFRPRNGTHSKLRIGGVSALLYDQVKKATMEWLSEVDASLCAAFGETVKGEPIPETLSELIFALADGIARRVTVVPPAPGEPDVLATAWLQSRAVLEVDRTASQAKEWQDSDLAALCAFQTLASGGSSTEAGRAVVEKQMHHIQYIINTPPMELSVTPLSAPQFNLNFLSHACDENVDFDVKCAIVQQWHAFHGAWAAAAANQAIQQIKQWIALPRRCDFINVLAKPAVGECTKRFARGSPVPDLPFVCGQKQWRFVTSSDHRTGLDLTGRRIVRLTSFVVQILSHGAIEKGLIMSQTVIPICWRCVLESRCVIDLLKLKRDGCSSGVHLLKFVEDVSDYESHLSDEVGNALLFVSRFSMIELLSIFHSNSPVCQQLREEFTLRTRLQIGNYQTAPCVPSSYHGFAYDSLAILMPLIQNRRHLMRVAPSRICNPIAILLRQSKIVQNWTPLKGTLHLSAEHTKEVNPLLGPVLQELSRRNVMVKWMRPYIGRGLKSSRMMFVFQTPTLVKLLAE